jgi:hypothetical protein
MAAPLPRLAAQITPRAAFLKLIDRKRVPLAAETRVRPDNGRYAAEHFTFAPEAGERVTGILMAHASATGRRPAVIVLHGTGVRKEEQLALLRTLADRGLTGIAIDARYHGERAKTNQGTDEYVGALLHAYLTAAVDPRIAVAVPVIGVQGFRWALDHDAWQARAATFQAAVDGAARDERTQVNASLVRRFYARVAPGIDGDFDAPAMLPLIAPRPLLVINGDLDPRTPLPAVLECMRAAESAYAAAGAQDKLGLYLQPHSGHVFTPVAELVALDWLVRWLAP